MNKDSNHILIMSSWKVALKAHKSVANLEVSGLSKRNSGFLVCGNSLKKLGLSHLSGYSVG